MKRGSIREMVPRTCAVCGPVDGENNPFVLKARCCPHCGQAVYWPQGKWNPYDRFTVAALLGIITARVFHFTHKLLQI